MRRKSPPVPERERERERFHIAVGRVRRCADVELAEEVRLRGCAWCFVFVCVFSVVCAGLDAPIGNIQYMMQLVYDAQLHTAAN